MIFILLTVLIISICYYLLKINYEHWEKKGVPGPKPRWIVGNMLDSFLLKKSPGEIYVDVYRAYPDAPIVGVFRASTPVLVLRDPDIIKEVTIRSFNSFHDNDFHVDKKNDPIFAKNPFVLHGDEWRIVRAQLTPGFTSGKMKWLYPHLEDNSIEMVKFIADQSEALDGRGYEAKELCTRYTLNTIANCAFGIEGKCFVENNSEFRQIAKEYLTPGGWTFVAFYLITLIPVLGKVLYFRLTPKKVEKKLFDLVSQTLKYREENNIVRNDFLHILIQLKKTCKDYEFTDMDVTAQASGFFVDGHESSSLIMSFLLYHLASTPEAQNKLREEVVKKFAENQDRLPYDALQEMPYLDAVVCESLRIHPGGWSLIKLCTKTFTFTSENHSEIKKPVVVEKGTPIAIPVLGLHRDSKFFEQPETFKPERFLGENRDKIIKCTYMPFGEGPRACLGQRFGTMQIKVGVAYIIKNYILTLNKKTKVPLEYYPVTPQLVPVGGLWIDFKKI